jgi:hypothetical protein
LHLYNVDEPPMQPGVRFMPSYGRLINLALAKYALTLDVKERLQLYDEMPVVVSHILAIELLECIDTLARDLAVKGVRLFKVSSIGGLRVTHLDLDGYRRLSLLTDRNSLMVALNGCSNDRLA